MSVTACPSAKNRPRKLDPMNPATLVSNTFPGMSVMDIGNEREIDRSDGSRKHGSEF